jgi:hypothetical protein
MKTNRRQFVLTAIVGAVAAACGVVLPAPTSPIKLRKVLVCRKVAEDDFRTFITTGFAKVEVGDCLVVEDMPHDWWQCDEKLVSLRGNRHALKVRRVGDPVAALLHEPKGKPIDRA